MPEAGGVRQALFPYFYDLFGVGSSIGRATDCDSVSCGFKSHPSPHVEQNLK